MAYDDSSIKVLSDIDHIRQRSSMYISTDRPSYQMWTEIADNAVDEAMNGYADKIIFNIDYNNNYISVEDNGRGLPQGMNEDLKKPTIFAIYQKLNAGGKYDQESYAYSGGLNGVGSTVVNALSKEFTVVSWRGKDFIKAVFQYGEEVDYRKFKSSEESKNGTRVSYIIDIDLPLFTDNLKDYEKDIANKISLLKTLMPNVTIIYNGEEVKPKDFREFLQLTRDSLLEESILIETKKYSLALNWSKDTNKTTHNTYCNSIFNPGGGDHLNAIYDAVADIFGNDGCYGLNVAVSVNYPGVEYDSQAKTKAVSKEMKQFLKGSSISEMKSYFRKNPDVKDKITELVKFKRNEINKRNNKSNVRREKKSTFLNALGNSNFADCSTKDRSEAELFIVEGNSAAGSARQARNVNTQAVAPLRGKIINAYTNGIDSLFKNQEVQMLLSSIDCGVFQDVNTAKSRYGKIIIMADGDPDGFNIASLLIALFMKVTPDLIKEGFIYLALPPLYGTYDKGKFVPITSEDMKNDYLKRGFYVKRFKGLGENNPDELAIACMDPATRSIIKITYSDGCEKIVEDVIGGDSSKRRELLVRAGILKE